MQLPKARAGDLEGMLALINGYASRERFLEKLEADCRACPVNLRCDETAMVRMPGPLVAADAAELSGAAAILSSEASE